MPIISQENLQESQLPKPFFSEQINRTKFAPNLQSLYDAAMKRFEPKGYQTKLGRFFKRNR